MEGFLINQSMFKTYLNKINELVKGYAYKPLTPKISNEVQTFYKSFIPEFLNLNGDNELEIYSSSGTLICVGYERIVVGDYGAYAEFTEDQSNDCDFEIELGQEYRVFDPKYSGSVKYIWLTINDGSNIKIYKQNKTVRYADYKENYYYICISECFIK
jgi:hypothetical protein